MAGFVTAACIAGVLLALARPGRATPTAEGRLVALAIRVHDLPKMERFYREAFGFRFEDATVGELAYRVGHRDGLRLKLVPIRAAPDHDGFPVHQPGFVVPAPEDVIELAAKLGGSLVGRAERRDGVVVRAAVRDPDGNTIELEREDE